MAPLRVLDGAHRRAAKTHSEQAIVSRRHSATLKMSEHQGSRLLAGHLLNLVGDPAANSADAPILSWHGRSHDRFDAACGGRAFGYHHNGKTPAGAIACFDLVAD